jgi:hypothetical protein
VASLYAYKITLLRKSLIPSLEDVGKFTALEFQTYKNNRLATYFAKEALITVFIDCPVTGKIYFIPKKQFFFLLF